MGDTESWWGGAKLEVGFAIKTGERNVILRLNKALNSLFCHHVNWVGMHENGKWPRTFENHGVTKARTGKSDTDWSRIFCLDTLTYRFVNTNINKAHSMQEKQTNTSKSTWSGNWPFLQLGPLLRSCRVNTPIDANKSQSRPPSAHRPTWSDSNRDMITDRVGTKLVSGPPPPTPPPTPAPFMPLPQGKKMSGGDSLSSLIAGKGNGRGGWRVEGGHHPASSSQANYTNWPGQNCHVSDFERRDVEAVCEKLTGINSCISMTATKVQNPNIHFCERAASHVTGSCQVKMLCYDCTKMEKTYFLDCYSKGKT